VKKRRAMRVSSVFLGRREITVMRERIDGGSFIYIGGARRVLATVIFRFLLKNYFLIKNSFLYNLKIFR
jgi:hypothetical protein